MATHSIRSAVKDRLLELIVTAVGDPTVEVSRWRLEPARESVYLGDITGTHDIPTMKAGRKARDDRWTIEIVVMTAVPGVGDPAVAEARAEQLLAAIEDVLADDPTLGGLPGLIWARLGQVNGPDGKGADEGWFAEVRGQIDCYARLT